MQTENSPESRLWQRIINKSSSFCLLMSSQSLVVNSCDLLPTCVCECMYFFNKQKKCWNQVHFFYCSFFCNLLSRSAKVSLYKISLHKKNYLSLQEIREPLRLTVWLLCYCLIETINLHKINYCVNWIRICCHLNLRQPTIHKFKSQWKKCEKKIKTIAEEIKWLIAFTPRKENRAQ